jgi:thiol-disulfide isomerase/thioredoxin
VGMTGLAVLAAALLLAAVLAAAHRWYDGRFRRRSGELPTSADLRESLPGLKGERATLVQFSSAFCAPCRATRRILADVASAVPGVAHVEIDAEAHLDLVRRLDILKTPTTLVLDDRGVEISRAVGQPKKTAVLAALGQAVRS